MEATEPQGNEEEEGSSSILGKDDNERNVVSDADQIVNAADQQVEERTPKRDHKEEIALLMEELQIIPPLVSVDHRPSAFTKNLHTYRLTMTNSKLRGLIFLSCLL